ncbi:MAG: apolipoprotein N-acyltransferase [Deltaproteobacteria bacterium]|nr:apolipoprotein N-acyltransferase [Deltaproteobacteria bacterium]
MTRRIILSIAASLMLIASMPPFDAAPLAWVAFVPLFFALDGAPRAGLGASLRDGFVLGFIYGFLFFLGSVYWVVNSMFYYGGVDLWISVPVMALLSAVLALYPALFGMIFTSVILPSGSTLRLALITAVWVALEYLRGYLFSGFPWAAAGYSQVPYLHIIQLADITGVWGISFLIVFVNAAIFFSLRAVLRRDALPYREAGIVAAVFLSVLTYGYVRVREVDSSIRPWKMINVALLQGNIDQAVKWDVKFQQKTLGIYRALSIEAKKTVPSLIVWPETAVPFYLGRGGASDASVGDIAKEAGSYILTGSPSYNYNQMAAKGEYFNSAYLFSPEGVVAGRYDKIHLVPFGEYVPMHRFLPFINKLTAGVGDFKAGPGPIPISSALGPIGVIICYEAIFPEISRGLVRNGAALLVNITNDAWFGRSSAPYQHFEMSVLRAVENRSYLVRAANTGISAVVDPAGRVRKESRIFETAVLSDTVGLRQGPLAFYTAYGDVFAYGCILLSGVFILWTLNKRRGQ